MNWFGGKNKAQPSRAELVKYVLHYFLLCGYEATSVTIRDKIGAYTVSITFSTEDNKTQS